MREGAARRFENQPVDDIDSLEDLSKELEDDTGTDDEQLEDLTDDPNLVEIDENTAGIMEGLNKAAVDASKEESEWNAAIKKAKAMPMNPVEAERELQKEIVKQSELLGKARMKRTGLVKMKEGILKETKGLEEDIEHSREVIRKISDKDKSASVSAAARLKESADMDHIRFDLRKEVEEAQKAYSKAYIEYSPKRVAKLYEGKKQEELIMPLTALTPPPFTARFTKKGRELMKLFSDLQFKVATVEGAERKK
ncbi:MAG TPA: hypothetical protein VLK22_02965 [Candidatus Udaeobacter sp.]|nr:hypothetical protein [Candidatus Udaeobacter sp.]